MNIITNNNELVERVLSLRDQDAKDEEIIHILESQFSLSSENAETVLELIQTGIFRASLMAGGLSYPKNNLENNQLVDTAIRIGLTKLGRPELYKSTNTINKPWWKIW